MLKYLFQQTVYHLLFTGLVYLILSAPYFGMTNFFLWLLTGFISAAAFYIDLKYRRPVPQNPVEQFLLNFYIASYGLVISIALAFFYEFAIEFDHPAANLAMLCVISPIYYFLMLGLVVRVDYPVTVDPLERESSSWQQLLRLAIREANR